MSGAPGGGRIWTVEEANAALADVGARLERIRELVAATRRARSAVNERRLGNGHAGTPAVEKELRAAVDELHDAGVVLRDLDTGLVDFPARLPDGRDYLLCWVLGEPEVAWWHWPEAGFAGRTPLSDPPA